MDRSPVDMPYWREVVLAKLSRKPVIECLLPGLLLLLLIPIEVTCAKSAFETIGEINSGVCWSVCIAGNSLTLILDVYWRFAAALVAILTGLYIIPYQVSLMVSLYQVQAEATRIVAFAYETERTTGQFPGTLPKYTYDNPERTEFIQSYQCGQQFGGFQLFYRVGTESTSHGYSPKDGWSYYPD